MHGFKDTTSATAQLDQVDPCTEIVSQQEPLFKTNEHSTSIYAVLSHAAKALNSKSENPERKKMNI